MTSGYLLALSPAELLAGSRILHHILNCDNPQVQREVDIALAGQFEGRDDAVRCAYHLHAALMAKQTESEDKE